MDAEHLRIALVAEAESLDRAAREYEQLHPGSHGERTVAIIMFRGMAAAKRAAAAALHAMAPQRSILLEMSKASREHESHEQEWRVLMGQTGGQMRDFLVYVGEACGWTVE